MVIITPENFEKEVLQAEIPVLIDFWASWCGPCKMMEPALDQLAEKLEGQIMVGKVDVEEHAELASRYSVVSIPTLMIFHNGIAQDQKIGAASLEVIESFLNDYIPKSE